MALAGVVGGPLLRGSGVPPARAGPRAEDYAAGRAFLARAGGLRPAGGRSLAGRRAPPPAARTRPGPPPGTPAELYLACVAAAYQLRAGPAPSTPPPPGAPP